MGRLWPDVVYAVRTFAKAPGFTVIAVLVLGAGIGANTAIFTVVNELLFRAKSGRAGELVAVHSRERTNADAYRGFSYPNYLDVRDRSGVFEALTAHTFCMVGTPAGDETKRTFASVVAANYFDSLGVRLAAGRPFTPDEERPGSRARVVIVTYARWKQEQLDPAFVGKSIRINADDYTVVGVTPEGFTGTMALVSAELFLPIGVYDLVVNDRFKATGESISSRASTGLILAGRLKPGMTAAQVTAGLEVFSRQLEAAYPAENKDQVLTISALSRVATSDRPQTDTGLMAFAGLLMGLSGVVLVIACLNIANMLLARGSARRREVALRLALGARRARVIRQLLTESVLLASAGAALGLLLSLWTTRALSASLSAALPLNVVFNTRPDMLVLLATLSFTALSTIAFGLGPALRLSRRDLVTDLKGRDDDEGRGRRFGARNLMVIGQVALSLAMLTAAGIFTRTALAAASGNPGHSYDRLMVANLDAALGGLNEADGRVAYRAVLDRARSQSGVNAATIASTLPFGDIQEGDQFERVGPGAQPVQARTHRVISADYFKSLGLRMVRGREFTRAEEDDPSAPHVVIVDEGYARRLFPADDPIGQMIRLARDSGASTSVPGEPMQIVGIAPPLKEELLDTAPTTHVYVPFARHYRSGMFLLVRHEAAIAAADAAATDLRAQIRGANARLAMLQVATLQTVHDRGLELWVLRTGAQMFAGLGLVALLLAVLGVYGVRSYVVAQRTREIGIRMALGANARDVVVLILKDGAMLAGCGVALGLPLAVLISVLFSKVFVGIGGFDMAVVGVATLALTSSAALASAIPAQRATRIQPLRALHRD